MSFKPSWEFMDSKTTIYSFPQMIGEVTQTSAILQTRLTTTNEMPENGFDTAEALLAFDIAGVEGTAKFEIADNPKFKNSEVSPWLQATPDRDFIIKYRINGLKADTQYYVRVHYGPTTSRTKKGPVSEFSTLQPLDSEKPTSFVVTHA